MPEENSSLTGTVNGLLSWTTGKIDTLFSFFGLYTSKYSKVILILLGIWIASKMLKIKLNLGGGGR